MKPMRLMKPVKLPHAITSLVALLTACSSHTSAVQPSAVRSSARSADVTRIAREELRVAMDQWHAEAGTIVALDLDTGTILAAIGRTAAGDDDTLPTRATWITGSTLKTFTHALAIDAGAVTPETMLDCRTRSWGDHAIQDASPHQDLSVRDALAVSSNVGASRIVDKLGFAPWLVGIKRFHFGDAPAVWPTVLDGTSYDAAMLAGGELGPATPLQVAAAYAAIFRDGTYLLPVPVGAPPGNPERTVSTKTAQIMIGLLENVVTSPVGTGTNAAIAGHHVAGKTGTMPLDEQRMYGSFIGRVLDGPNIVLMVGLVSADQGHTGGKSAAPVFAKVMQRLL